MDNPNPHNAMFGDDEDGGIDFTDSVSADVSGGGDLSATIADATQTVGQVAKAAASGIKVVGAVQALAHSAGAVAAGQQAAAQGAPPAVVQAHANAVVVAAQRHVVALRLAPHSASPAGITATQAAALAASPGPFRKAEPFLFAGLGGSGLGGLGWWALKIPGAVGGGVVGIALGAALGLYLRRHP